MCREVLGGLSAMTLTQALLVGVALIGVGLLLGLFGMFVLAARIDRNLEDLKNEKRK